MLLLLWSMRTNLRPVKQFALLSMLGVSHAAFGQYHTTTLLKDLTPTPLAEPSNQAFQLMASGAYHYYVTENNQLLRLSAGGGALALTGMYNLTAIRDITPSQGGKIYFIGETEASGAELYVSDGTPNGTRLVRDLFPGATGSVPMELTDVCGTLYFSASDGTNGRELWKTNGTNAGTVRVKDIIRGSGSSNPAELAKIDCMLYFTANDGRNGYELWRSDGTDGGTFMLKDVRIGAGLSSTPRQITQVNSTIYFTAFVGATGRELYKSDGTAAGTVLVKDIRTGTAESVPDNLTAVGSTLYFGANNGTNGRELWKSNGTAAGTVLVKDITPGSASNTGAGYAHLSHFRTFNGRLAFMAYTDRPRVWVSNGTSAGTNPISPLSRNFVDIDPNITIWNGWIYYVNNGSAINGDGYMEMWRNSGSGVEENVGTMLGKWLNADMQVAPNSDYMLFVTKDDYSGYEHTIYYTRGPGDTDTFFKPGDARGSDPSFFTTYGNHVYFDAPGAPERGLWRTDGTAAGTVIFKQMSNPLKYFKVAGGLLYFLEDRGTTETLWRTDGTIAGTIALMNVMQPSRQYFLEESSGGLLYVVSDSRLYRSNGTVAGSMELRMFPNPIGWVSDAGAELLIAADDGARGLELWKSDGTASGTTLLRDIRPGSASSLIPGGLVDYRYDAAASINGVAYFLANAGGDANYELWRSDGTSSGTRMIKNDATGVLFEPMSNLAVANNILYFFTRETINDEQIQKISLYKSDGTTGGTVKLKTLKNDRWNGDQYEIMVGGGSQLYFFTTVYVQDHYFWTSDGTPEGTLILENLGVRESINPVYAAFNGDLTYISNGYYYDMFLYRTDGTSCGTFPISVGSDPQYEYVVDIYLATLGNKLITTSWQEDTGREPHYYIDDAAPCGSMATVSARVISDEKDLGYFAKGYPNPFVNEINLVVPGEEGKTYNLFVQTMTGVKVEQQAGLKHNETYHFGDSWAPGVYFMRVQKEGASEVIRLVKTK